jgi:hypothetical protein
MATKVDPDSTRLPNLSAAVLDGKSVGLRRELQAKGIPCILYIANEQTDDAPIIQMPAPAAGIARGRGVVQP